MFTTSRRSLILSAAVAGAALGLDGSLAIAAPTRRQQTPDPTPGFFRHKVGDAECTALYDGIWEKAHDQALFSNATVAETKEALAAAGFTTAFVTIPITVFVIKLNDKLVMCDAGGGDQVQAFNPQSCFVSGRLMANMKAAGIDPKKIETVLVSHFHPDHIFGLLEKKPTHRYSPMRKSLCPRPNTSSGPTHRSPAGCPRGAGHLLIAFRPSSRCGRTCFPSRAKMRSCPGSVSSARPVTRPAIPLSTSARAMNS